MLDLPELTTDDVWRVRGQLYGALALLRDNEAIDEDDGLQTVMRLLEVGIDLSEHLVELVDNYTTIVARDVFTRARQTEGAEA